MIQSIQQQTMSNPKNSPELSDGRYLVRDLYVNSEHRGLSYLQISQGKVRVEPFQTEEHSTVYINQSVRLLTDGDNLLGIEGC